MSDKEITPNIPLSELNLLMQPEQYENRPLWGQAENPVHMLNWAVRSVKFLGVEFDQSEDEEVAVSDTTHL